MVETGIFYRHIKVHFGVRDLAKLVAACPDVYKKVIDNFFASFLIAQKRPGKLIKAIDQLLIQFIKGRFIIVVMNGIYKFFNLQC
jgi:hypothetical protein